ncbi:MAG: hypothetical protein DHS20C15_04220 [Planctomycetota bacterium]|nr:MAG: hypothetical protein DHS20C15_04220 [Planctomycetota bacterium]
MAEASIDSGATSQGSSAPREFSPALRFLALCVELALVLGLTHVFELEASSGLLELTPWVFGGFLLHAALPARWRLRAFLALSLAGFAVVFGPALAACMVALGLTLLVICHLPVPWWLRLSLLGVMGTLLTAARAEWVFTDWSLEINTILPVLGSIFMFRLVLYVYELRTENPDLTASQRLAYFFMLPNALFALFPIIDSKTFRRTYYDRDALEIYTKGVRWMGRGVTHLLIYRIIYQHFTPNVEAVSDLGGVLLSMVSSYALYLRVSGVFHLVIGMLGLFGFNLPETHHHYFLASGFNDLWRRINIYWTDFMMKIVYYPIFLRLRRRSPTRAMVVATLSVFMISWWLHSYQWFWIRGSFPMTAVDAIFWSLFAVTVLANSLLQARAGAARSLRGKRVTPRSALVHALKVVGMFSFMCALWSFWTGGSIDGWLKLVSAAGNSPPSDFMWLFAGVAGALAVGTIWQLVAQRPWTALVDRPSFRGAWCSSMALLLGLLWIGSPQASGFEDNTYVASLRKERLNAHDEARRLRGYYEEILDERHDLGVLGQLAQGKPAHWLRLSQTDALMAVSDRLYDAEFIPNHELMFCEASLTTNRWGLRDKDYSLEKPPNTVRIALLGASIEMGTGVENHQTFEARLERQLNEERAADAPQVEILNFAVAGYSPLAQLDVLNARARAFEPDIVMLVAHTIDPQLVMPHLARLMERDKLRLNPQLQQIVEKEAIDPYLEAGPETKHDIWRDQRRLLTWVYNSVASICHAQQIEPVWVFLQHPPNPSPAQVLRGEKLHDLALKAGFTTLMLDGERVYPADRWASLTLRPWDNHPNVEGHQRIADELLRQLREHPQLLAAAASTTER